MVERLSSSDSEQHLLYIPIHFLVDLPVKKSAALRPLLLRHLWMRGKQLLLDYLHNPQCSAMSLKGTEILLDRFFTVEKISADCTRRDAVIAYLEPIGVLLDGIVSVALTHGSSDADNLSLARAILDALQLPSKTTVFAAVINDADIWLEAKTVTRDILFQTKKMQECFPRFINIAFYSQAIRREQEALDGKLRAENEKGIGEYSLSSLSLSLLSAFGEAVHHQDVVVSYRKVNTQEALSVMLKNCRSRVFEDRDEAVYVNQYVMSYLAATFDYILDSLRKDQYSFPESFDTLPAKMKAVIKGSKSSNCDPQFLILVEMYLDLFEEQILNTLTAFNAKKISKKELDRLDQSPHILRILEKIAHSWELQVREISSLLWSHTS